MNTFITKTDHKAYSRMMALIMTIVGMSPAAVIVIFSKDIKSSLLFLAVYAIVWAGVSIFAISTNNDFTLVFEGAKLHISGKLPNQRYVVWDVPASDFVITQTSKKQKENNTCNLKIKNTVFKFYFVCSCEEMKEYIKNNFPSA